MYSNPLLVAALTASAVALAAKFLIFDRITMAPKLELIYFNIRGRADIARSILFDGGIEFKDTRIPYEEKWPRKSEFVFGQLPVLVIDGKTQLAQSAAIARYCCSLVDKQLLGNNDLEAAEIDMWYHQAEDVYTAIMMPYFDANDTFQQLFQDKWAERMAPFEKKLSNGDGFIVSNRLTLADYLLLCVTEICDKINPQLLKATAGVAAHRQRMLQREGLVKFKQHVKDLYFFDHGQF